MSHRLFSLGLLAAVASSLLSCKKDPASAPTVAVPTICFPGTCYSGRVLGYDCWNGVLIQVDSRFPIGKPLPGRTSIIVTRQPGYRVPGAIVVDSVDAALKACAEYAESFVIGGAELYRQTLGYCQRMCLTEIQQDFDGDTFFPEFSREQWRETSREKHRLDDASQLEYHFVVLER